MKEDMHHQLDYGELRLDGEGVAEQNSVEYAAENGDNKISILALPQRQGSRPAMEAQAVGIAE